MIGFCFVWFVSLVIDRRDESSLVTGMEMLRSLVISHDLIIR